MAKIDVLLPVRNAAAFLAQAIESIRQQTVTDWRLCILDHGSADGSCDIANRYARMDQRIQVYPMPGARHLADLLNHGLALCNGAYVMRHDADDICYPDRMEITLDAFARSPRAVVVGGQAEVIDEQGHPVGSLQVPVGQRRISAASLFINPVIHPTVTFHRERFLRLGACYGRDFSNLLPQALRSEFNSLAEDYFLFGQLALMGRCVNVDVSLIRYRRHATATGVAGRSAQLAMSLAVSRYLARLFATRHQVPVFDPVPFCSHGQQLVPWPGRELIPAFADMQANLQRGLGQSDGLERELAFREILTTRSACAMWLRYRRFAHRTVAEPAETGTVRSWMLRHVSARPVVAPPVP